MTYVDRQVYVHALHLPQNLDSGAFVHQPFYPIGGVLTLSFGRAVRASALEIRFAYGAPDPTDGTSTPQMICYGVYVISVVFYFT